MEQIERTLTILTILLGTGFVSFAGWVISLRTQLRKVRNEAINSDSDTTDKSLKVSMELIATTETLLGKVAIMSKQVSTLSAELTEVTNELQRYKNKVAAYVQSCTCGASNSLT